MTRVHRDADIEFEPLLTRTVAVVGYGNQGHAHALNLRDSGCHITIGQRGGSRGWHRAIADGFDPQPVSAAVAAADLIIVALPDEIAPEVYAEHIAPHLRAAHSLGFIHGFNIHYRRITPPLDVDVILVAPKGAGYMVRDTYRNGSGLPCLVAIHADAGGQALALALAWAKGIGGGRGGILTTTFAEETETDLFGEQASVVGGVCALMATAFDVLVQAGYAPEHAYFECVHEVKFVVDLIHRHGIRGMHEHISGTAAFGARTRGPRLAAAVRPIMEQMLREIRDGHFAAELTAATAAGRPADPAGASDALLDQTGAVLRGLGSPPEPE